MMEGNRYRPAAGAREAGAVVRLAQSRNDFSFDEASAVSTLGAEQILIILGAVVIVIFAEEATLGQRRLAHLAFKTLDVEIFLLDSQHLTCTFLFAALTHSFTCNGANE